MKTYRYTGFIPYAGLVGLALVTVALAAMAWTNQDPKHPEAYRPAQPGHGVITGFVGALITFAYWRFITGYKIVVYGDRIEAGVHGNKVMAFSDVKSFRKTKKGAYFLTGGRTQISFGPPLAHLDDLVSELQKKVPLEFM